MALTSENRFKIGELSEGGGVLPAHARGHALVLQVMPLG